MDDVDRLLARLDDPDPQVRDLAAAATWQIWSRSGDPAIDKLFARGMDQMEAAALETRSPPSASSSSASPPSPKAGTSGRRSTSCSATSPNRWKDCDEVLKRNPKHFGALSGAGQIHLQLGHPGLALDFFRRALAVNPNLEGAAAMIPVLELLREQQPQRDLTALIRGRGSHNPPPCPTISPHPPSPTAAPRSSRCSASPSRAAAAADRAANRSMAGTVQTRSDRGAQQRHDLPARHLPAAGHRRDPCRACR